MKYLLSIILALIVIKSNSQEKVFPGADEKTPSKAEYFSWINNTNEGATEQQTEINLDFFHWLKTRYGMQLDIYAFDAGAIDGKRFYGSMKSERFKKQFPYGFDSIYQKAKKDNIRLGIWGGPDGFGNTPEEEKDRTEQMVSLCRDYHFALFKFDAVCGPLRPEKEDAFINMMKQCRKYSPDLILLNHRLGLDKAKPYATTFLWEGAETYIDVFMTNNTTAPHHRAGALGRGQVPGLQRLTEDHGVCLSSCLDYWDDDLVLQAFNRDLILSPEIYGNPWFLRDDEFPKLARIFNLHKKYNDILVNGLVLPEEKYGKNAVSRGDNNTRLITLRNNSWLPVQYNIALNSETGLAETGKKIQVVQLHPRENHLGNYNYNQQVTVTVEPFRSALFLVTSDLYDEPVVYGTEYNVVRNIQDKNVLIDLISDPGTSKRISPGKNTGKYKSVRINGLENRKLLSGKSVKISFPGKKLKQPVHRKITDLREIPVPPDAEALYEATVFSADNNALEVRSIFRSGFSKIPEVKRAQEAFFNQKTFVNRGVWDKNLFDGNMHTGFWPSTKYDYDVRIKGGAFRLDLGESIQIDELRIHVPDYFSLHPLLYQEGNYAEVSDDLIHWKTITYLADTLIKIPIHQKIRYVRLRVQPQQIVEVEGFYNGKPLNRRKWRASNLFAHPGRMKCVKAWYGSFTLSELADSSYLSIALNGKHGVEGAYVAAKIDGKLVGAPDRAPSYPSNTWEYLVAWRDANYTYYIPMKQEYVDKKIEIFVMAYDKNNTGIKPEVWISSYTDGKKKIRLELVR